MKKIKVIGLGPGHLDQIPLNVYRLLEKSNKIYVRTAEHPAVSELIEEGMMIESYDAYYEEFDEKFEIVYPAIVEDLLKKAQTEEVIYAVPGHPLVAEKTVELLLESDVEIEIIGGKSFIDDMFASVQVDPIDGFQLMDALNFSIYEVQAKQNIIFMQVFSPFVASDLKLDLMEIYPPEHLVARVDAAGSPEESVEWVELAELDFFEGVHNLLSVFVPALSRDENTRQLSTTLSYTDDIYGEKGDLWLKEKTAIELIPYLREEVEEFIDALTTDEDDEHIAEELGDVLMQIIYQAKLAQGEERFSFTDVLNHLNTKLRRRHPHVFDDVVVNTIEEIEVLWNKIKREEEKDETR